MKSLAIEARIFVQPRFDPVTRIIFGQILRIAPNPAKIVPTPRGPCPPGRSADNLIFPRWGGSVTTNSKN